MHPIAERIMDNEVICPGEIWQYNASRIIERERIRAARGTHDPKKCKVKDCSHGFGNDLFYAAELTERATRECVCGAHT